MNEIRQIQDVIIGIFKVVSEICERNGIRYFAIGGTCLGAVRHKGFIPWDDDLDIAIPIDDFNKFINIARKELPQFLEIYTPSSSVLNRLFFIKVTDNRTTLIENHCVKRKDSYKGVWVDVMPISGVPAPGSKRESFLRRDYIYKRLNTKTKTGFPLDGTVWGRLSWIFSYPLRLLPHDIFWKSWIKWISNFSFDKSDYVGYVWSAKIKKLIFPKKWFEDFVYLKFEDIKVRCPKNYHDFLTQMFGNYMEYPPEEERTSGHMHDKGVVDLTHSYKDYQSGKLPLPKSIVNNNN